MVAAQQPAVVFLVAGQLAPLAPRLSLGLAAVQCADARQGCMKMHELLWWPCAPH